MILWTKQFIETNTTQQSVQATETQRYIKDYLVGTLKEETQISEDPKKGHAING